jgi:hypothetical protein
MKMSNHKHSEEHLRNWSTNGHSVRNDSESSYPKGNAVLNGELEHEWVNGRARDDQRVPAAAEFPDNRQPDPMPLPRLDQQPDKLLRNMKTGFDPAAPGEMTPNGGSTGYRGK